MRKLALTSYSVRKIVVPKKVAEEIFKKRKESYKLEILKDIGCIKKPLDFIIMKRICRHVQGGLTLIP